MPDGVEKAVEHVQEHCTNVGAIFEIDRRHGSGQTELAKIRWELHLPGITATPDDHGQAKEDNQGDLGSERAADLVVVQAVAEDEGSDNLRSVVKHTVQSTCANIEVSTVHAIEVVGVKPVGGQEHGEEQNDVWV